METYDERVPERVWKKVEVVESGCWEWRGAKSRGYGYTNIEGRGRGVHRFIYEKLIGPIPKELVCDHLCENPGCVKPSHLQIVKQRTNVLRSKKAPSALNALKTHCARGHEYREGSFYVPKTGGRACRACHVENSAERRSSFSPEKRAAVLRRQRERMENLRRSRRLGIGANVESPKDSE